MRGFLFTDDVLNISDDTFYVRLYPRIQSVRGLFKALYYSCWYPEYFGFNWDALDEIVSDYYWIKEKNIIIRHCCFSGMSERDISIYISSLVGSFEYFPADDKNVCYVFAESDKKRIIDLIRSDEYVKDAERLILN